MGRGNLAACARVELRNKKKASPRDMPYDLVTTLEEVERSVLIERGEIRSREPHTRLRSKALNIAPAIAKLSYWL